MKMPKVKRNTSKDNTVVVKRLSEKQEKRERERKKRTRTRTAEETNNRSFNALISDEICQACLIEVLLKQMT